MVKGAATLTSFALKQNGLQIGSRDQVGAGETGFNELFISLPHNGARNWRSEQAAFCHFVVYYLILLFQRMTQKQRE